MLNNPQRFLYIGIAFIAIAAAEVVVFRSSTLGLGASAVFFIIGVAFIARSRRGTR